LQETKALKIFKALICAIIGEFEEDRSFIAHEMSEFDQERNFGKNSEEEIQKTALQIIEQQEKRNLKDAGQRSAPLAINNKKSKLIVLAEYSKRQKETIERLEDEQIILRGMASSGIVSASFGHDLDKVKSSLETRIDTLKKLLSPKITTSDFNNSKEHNNPYIYMDGMKQDDKNIAMWLGFSLGFVRKDKRKRKQIYLAHYFKELQSNWFETLKERGIAISIDCPKELILRAFEIDFDSIFLNLIVNSIDAFKKSKKQEERKITILCQEINKIIRIEYLDTGPGLIGISDPELIFRPLFTTKLDESGQEIGTGLGMWIIKSITEEYKTKPKLLLPSSNTGFGIRFDFPIKYKQN